MHEIRKEDLINFAIILNSAEVLNFDIPFN